MSRINLQKREQIFTLKDDKKVVCVAIEINGEDTICFSHNGTEKLYKTKELGCINLESDIEAPITEFEFEDLY